MENRANELNNYNESMDKEYPSLEKMKDILGHQRYLHWVEINRLICDTFWQPLDELDEIAEKLLKKWKKK